MKAAAAARTHQRLAAPPGKIASSAMDRSPLGGLGPPPVDLKPRASEVFTPETLASLLLRRRAQAAGTRPQSTYRIEPPIDVSFRKVELWRQKQSGNCLGKLENNREITSESRSFEAESDR